MTSRNKHGLLSRGSYLEFQAYHTSSVKGITLLVWSIRLNIGIIPPYIILYRNFLSCTTEWPLGAPWNIYVYTILYRSEPIYVSGGSLDDIVSVFIFLVDDIFPNQWMFSVILFGFLWTNVRSFSFWPDLNRFDRIWTNFLENPLTSSVLFFSSRSVDRGKLER